MTPDEARGASKQLPAKSPLSYRTVVTGSQGRKEQVVQKRTIPDFFGDHIAHTGIAKSGWHVKVAQVETPMKSYRPGLQHGNPTVQK